LLCWIFASEIIGFVEGVAALTEQADASDGIYV
jgi:hypothetical protein